MKKNSGFTLIELLIVMIIMSIVLVSIIRIYELYYNEIKITTTKENLETVRDYLNLQDNGGFFCPSDRALSINHPSFGYQFDDDCDLGQIPNCSSPMTQGVCEVTRLNGEQVIIGGIPFASIRDAIDPRIGNDSALDGWNNQITYAVSANLVKPNANLTQDAENGQIGAIDESGNPTAGMNDDAHYVLFSHG